MAPTSAKKPLRVRDEIAELERYLISCKEQSQKSLQALRDGESASPLSGISDASDPVNELQASLHALQSENDALRAQHQHLQATIASQTNEPSSLSLHALQARCSRLESELSAARMAALTNGSSQKGSRHNSDTGAGTSSTSRAASIANGSTHGTVPAMALLLAFQKQVQQLKADREGLEDQVVNMYEELFRDDIVSGLISLVRRKENEIIASLDTSGGGGGGKKNGFARPAAPRLKQKLDDATERIEKLEKELKARASEMDAADRHHKDILKIATLESTAQADHFKVCTPLLLFPRQCDLGLRLRELMMVQMPNSRLDTLGTFRLVPRAGCG
jgi:chromosome segregation ATPase